MKNLLVKIQNASTNESSYPSDLSEFILKSLFDGTQSPICLFSPSFRIIFFNKYAQSKSKLFGVHNLVCGESVFKYRNERNKEFIDEFKVHFDKAIKTKRLVVSECQMRYSEKNFWIRAEYMPVYTAEYELFGVLINLQNISDRKRAEYKSEQKQIQLDQIAWSHSHETRKPLATLLGLLNIFDRTSLTEDNTELIKLLESTALQLENVIKKNVDRANIDIQGHGVKINDPARNKNS